jgi:hypothetical protein
VRLPGERRVNRRKQLAQNYLRLDLLILGWDLSRKTAKRYRQTHHNEQHLTSYTEPAAVHFHDGIIGAEDSTVETSDVTSLRPLFARQFGF